MVNVLNYKKEYAVTKCRLFSDNARLSFFVRLILAFYSSCYL
jgi:hypothetical protein